VSSEVLLPPAVLADAFADFSEAAASLERSYGELQVEVAQLRETLAERNRALHSSLAENAEIKQTLAVILDSLPCGVLVLDGSQNPTLINPEGRRMLGIQGDSAGSWDSTAVDITRIIATASFDGNDAELCVSGDERKRWLAVRGRQLDGIAGAGIDGTKSKGQAGQVLILRDISAQRQMEVEREVARNAVALAEVSASGSEQGRHSSCLIGESQALTRALERAAAAARTDADVLIQAESGTGKELLARFIHEHSQRMGKRFVAVNCAAVPEALLESELFGHARGAFTGAVAAKQGKFELANGGTLLLDEVGEMPIALQPKLLRVLQEREFERVGETRTVSWQARVVATSNISLLSLVEAGRFRADLYYRLNVIPLTLPPLRERAGDIAILARHFAGKIAAQQGRAVPSLLPDFLERLEEYAWPGNVRELQNLMRRMLALHPGLDLDAGCLDAELCSGNSRGACMDARPGLALRPGTPMRDLERELLEKTLVETCGNRTRTADLLGISVRTVRNKIREYGLPPRRYA
jgi:transcriptional regulator with PAS, ATPase and Fis domain